MDSGFDGFQKVLNNIAHYLHRANFTFSFVSVFINIFHFIILTRKSMRTSSTNVVMIGIAISDSCTMLTTIYKHYQLVDVENPECVTSAYKYKIYMDLVAWSFQDHFRRCSSWMGVLMATVRLVIMKKMTDNKNLIVENRTFSLPINCAEYQDVTSRPPYSVMLTPLFSFNDMIVLRVYVMFDAIVTKFIPCISFPILTVFLLRQLRKFHNLGPSNGRKQSVANEERNELTTKLIVFMTIAFFIAEAPLGMIYMVKVFFNRSDQIL
ncbi:hypothetical protein GCK72_019555 [Caenorhabditis remanei]|uniref:G-protein coupled receptors family 1 profile domain-containing protein n=1 Tax=Caenorhabditis remanei TaxID=31234 RepID=A0A6A5GD64_CAERE|nr:hypothetical protein GCK72_019555 [Caenorhabditis remanei]KAF1753000.1 hypothetical protein GCK72_019555 [Caenorhabditis remanei]